MMDNVEIADLPSLIGTVIGKSEWVHIDQDRINVFADVTEDHQFIHIDTVKAKQTPFGGTIAHGFLTLSLLAKFAESATIKLKGVAMGVNYGLESMRFLNPVAVDSNVRGVFTLKDAVEKKPGQFLLTYAVAVEIEGVEKPALVADWLGMQFLAP